MLPKPVPRIRGTDQLSSVRTFAVGQPLLSLSRANSSPG
jgi:hypothetical protein